jgi:folylpolyglutamate synthase/dihydropteroate synthase
MDHQEFLGDRLAVIAAEKAGIIKPGCTVVTGLQAPEALAEIIREAALKDAVLLRRGRDWEVAEAADGLVFNGMRLPKPALIGAHNPGGGQALAEQLDRWPGPTTLVVGMKQSKDVAEFLAPLLPRAAKIFAVAEPGQHLALPIDQVIAASGGVAIPGPDVATALRQITVPTRVLICGSLYLAGEVLKLDAGPDL